MSNTNKLKTALKLYPFYEAASGDFLFFSVIQTLFLTQVKGFSAAQIATILLITDIVDITQEYPSYRIIRRLGNSAACVIGGFMPLIGILLITFGQSIPVVTAGMIFFVCAGNFQSMAGAAARNNLMLIGDKEGYVKLFSRGNTIYSAVSMVSAAVIPFLFSFNRYIPSVMCIITCGMIAVISFFISDYSEQKGILPPLKDRQELFVRLGKGFWLLLIVFCMFFCAGAVFTSNSEILLSSLLELRFSEQNTIYIYGLVIWAARFLKLGTNIVLPKILDRLKKWIVPAASAAMLIFFAAVGLSSLQLRGTMLPIIIIGFAYVVIKGILWDPLRTFLRMSAIDTNSKKRQQTILVYLNVGQSVVSIIMDLIVVVVLNILAIEYVFLAFAFISVMTVISAILLMREFRKSREIMNYETTLDEGAIDSLSQIIYDKLLEAGMVSKEALSYRLLAEEKLMECIFAGKMGNTARVSITVKLGEYYVILKVGNDEKDIFMLPGDGDPVSQMIYNNILRGI